MDPLEEPGIERDDRPAGPGLEAKPGLDPTLITAWVFVVLGFTPGRLWLAILSFDYFGPIEVSAILMMVGVLFGFIAVLRSIDLGDVRLRWGGAVAVGLGLLRLLFSPLW